MLGAYFVALRPPLLPEDLRFLGTSAGAFVAGQPRLAPWLNLVFAVLGGQMAALGLMLVPVAARLMREDAIARRELALVGAAGALAAGLMSAVNFALGSDFRWLLLLPILVWSVGVACATLGTTSAKERSSA